MQNLSHENEFDLNKNCESVGRTHFHVNDFVQTHLTQRQKTPRKWPILLIKVCLGLPVLLSNSFSQSLASQCKDIGKETSI